MTGSGERKQVQQSLDLTSAPEGLPGPRAGGADLEAVVSVSGLRRLVRYAVRLRSVAGSVFAGLSGATLALAAAIPPALVLAGCLTFEATPAATAGAVVCAAVLSAGAAMIARREARIWHGQNEAVLALRQGPALLRRTGLAHLKRIALSRRPVRAQDRRPRNR